MKIRISLLLVIALVLGGATFVYGLRWLEWAMTFHPEHLTQKQRELPPPARAQDVWFSAADGTRLHGWYFKSQVTPETGTIINFHGKGGSVLNVGWVGEYLSRKGFSVLLFDYRGYGLSGGVPTDELHVYLDGEAAHAFVVNEKHASPERIILYGQSLGTAVATEVATRKPCGALILESGFSSASAVAIHALPWLPRWLHFLGRNRFESAQKLTRVHVPVLITHGDPDLTIPTDEGRALFAAANQPKRLLIVPGAGHNVFGSAGPGYLDQLEQFIRSALPQSTTAVP